MLSVREIQTPVYLYDMEAFRGSIAELITATRREYPRYHVGYSYKTNGFDGFCQAVNSMGEYAEVVSPNEYAHAKEIGVSSSKVIYNGVIPDFMGKLEVARNGGIANIDNMAEYMKFVDFSTAQREPISIGVRLNVDIGNGVPSRFGFDVEGEDFKRILDAEARPYLDIKAVHCHISQARKVEHFVRRVQLASKYARMLGATNVDIGGNMYGRMDADFASQFAKRTPTLSEYGDAIGREMRRQFPDCGVTLISEGGTPFASTGMHLLATVLDVKKIRSRTYIVLDTKREEVGASCLCKNPSYRHYGAKKNYVEHAMLVGCTCVEIDFLQRDYCGPANIGDKILFMNVGAYSYSTTNDFITSLCRKAIDVRLVNFD